MEIPVKKIYASYVFRLVTYAFDIEISELIASPEGCFLRQGTVP